MEFNCLKDLDDTPPMKQLVQEWTDGTFNIVSHTSIDWRNGTVQNRHRPIDQNLSLTTNDKRVHVRKIK